MRLIQIPFSHNCVKVRLALERKGLPHEIENIPPVDRSSPRRSSGQTLVPVLVDGDRVVSDSTAILLHLETRFPDPPLLPRDPAERAECLLLEDWADGAFMAATRRIAYRNGLRIPGRLAEMFFPERRGIDRAIRSAIARRIVVRRFGISEARYRKDCVAVRRAAVLAVDRLGGKPHLVGGRLTIADLALATMSAPLFSDPTLREEPGIRELLAWSAGVVGPEVVELYRL